MEEQIRAINDQSIMIYNSFPSTLSTNPFVQDTLQVVVCLTVLDFVLLISYVTKFMPLHGQIMVLPLTRARVGSSRWGILRAVVVFLVQTLSVYYLC